MIVPALVALGCFIGSPHCHHGHAHHTRAQRQRIALRREMRGYHRHPLPWCTWGPESGRGLPQWSIRRYRALNPSTLAGGKFQVIPSTWRLAGGLRYATAAQRARPVYQERVARVVARWGISSQWVNC